MPLDTLRRHATPEGVEISLRVAGPVSRLLAWLIDLSLICATWFIASIPLALAQEVGMGLQLLLLFALNWLYPVLCEVYWRGATAGKHAMGILVVHDDGTPVGIWSSAIRNVLRFADFLPVFYGIGLLSVLATRDFKRLGDLAAGTIVVHAEGALIRKNIRDSSPIAPPRELDLAGARAVMDYAERLPTWTRERAEELADKLSLLTDRKGEAGVERLLGIANWLVGRR